MFGVLFYLLFVLLFSSHRCLDVSLFENIQDYKVQDFEQLQAESMASVPRLYWSYMLSPSSSHYCRHPLNWIPTYTFRIGNCVWVVLLSPAVLSIVQVFHLYDVECVLCLWQNYLEKGFIVRINLSDSRWSENTINTHKYNTIYWSSNTIYYNLGLCIGYIEEVWSQNFASKD
jgi:hypothetical protein